MHPAENCFMHQADKVTEEYRLDRACEPGVDYGKQVYACVSVCEPQCLWLWLCTDCSHRWLCIGSCVLDGLGGGRDCCKMGCDPA